MIDRWLPSCLQIFLISEIFRLLGMFENPMRVSSLVRERNLSIKFNTGP